MSRPDRPSCGPRRRLTRPSRAAARSKNSWRAACAACSIETPASRASAATSTARCRSACQHRCGKPPAELLVGIRLGPAKLMIQMRRADDRETFGRRQSREHAAAAPPNRRRRTARQPHGFRAEAIRERRMVRRTESMQAHMMHWCDGCEEGRGANGCGSAPNAPTAPSHPAHPEKWCRCRDLNPGQRGYEPRALTN